MKREAPFMKGDERRGCPSKGAETGRCRRHPRVGLTAVERLRLYRPEVPPVSGGRASVENLSSAEAPSMRIGERRVFFSERKNRLIFPARCGMLKAQGGMV